VILSWFAVRKVTRGGSGGGETPPALLEKKGENQGVAYCGQTGFYRYQYRLSGLGTPICQTRTVVSTRGWKRWNCARILAEIERQKKAAFTSHFVKNEGRGQIAGNPKGFGRGV